MEIAVAISIAMEVATRPHSQLTDQELVPLRQRSEANGDFWPSLLP